MVDDSLLYVFSDADASVVQVSPMSKTAFFGVFGVFCVFGNSAVYTTACFVRGLVRGAPLSLSLPSVV